MSAKPSKLTRVVSLGHSGGHSFFVGGMAWGEGREQVRGWWDKLRQWRGQGKREVMV